MLGRSRPQAGPVGDTVPRCSWAQGSHQHRLPRLPGLAVMLGGTQPAPWRLGPTAHSTTCLGSYLLVRGQPPLLPAPHPTLHPALHPSPHPSPLRLVLPLCAAEQAAANLPQSTGTAARAGCCPTAACGTAATLCHRAPGSHRDRPPSRAGYGASGHRHVPTDHPVLMVGHSVPVVGHPVPMVGRQP